MPRRSETDAAELTTRRTLSVWPEAGQMLGLGRTTTYEMVRTGKLPVLRFGRRLVVPRAQLAALLREKDERGTQ